MENNKKNNAYHIINELFNLYSNKDLLKEDDSIFSDDDANEIDMIIEKNLNLFRKLQTKAKAELNELKYQRALDNIERLKKGLISSAKQTVEFINSKLTPQELAQLQPLFNNLTDISDNDKKSIMEDVKLLEILNKIDFEEE